MTLYTTRLDEGSPGKSRCTNARYTIQNGRQFGKVPLPAPTTRKTCAYKRPPFLAGADATPANGDWTLIARDDGARQWAFHGKPLYTSIKDHAARRGERGDVHSTNYVVWGAAQAPLEFPPGFKLLSFEEGQILAVSDGRPVYIHGAHGQGPCGGRGNAVAADCARRDLAKWAANGVLSRWAG